MSSGGIEPAIPAIKSLQTYVLDNTANFIALIKLDVRFYKTTVSRTVLA